MVENNWLIVNETLSYFHLLGSGIYRNKQGFISEEGKTNMLEEIKKGLLSGLGVILLTREKAEEATNKLVEEAKISEEEARNFVDRLFATGTKQRSEVEANLSETIRKVLDNMDIASKKELHGLKSKVGKLEKRLETIEQRIDTEKES